MWPECSGPLPTPRGPRSVDRMGFATMGDHLWISCPHCRRSNLRIRPENIGNKVICKHCHQAFIARMADDPNVMAPAPPRLAPTHGGADATEDRERQVLALQTELQQLQDELAGRTD